MTFATCAAYLLAHHPVAVVTNLVNVAGIYRLEKTWPSSSGIVLIYRPKEFKSAAGTDVCTVGLVGLVFTGERLLGGA